MSIQQPKSGNTTIAVVSAIFMLVLAVWTLCGSVGALLGGSMLAGLGSTLTQMGADAPQELTEVAAAGGAFGITGILLLVVAVAYLIVAVGVLQRKQWSRMGTVIVNGIYVVVALLGMILAGDRLPVLHQRGHQGDADQLAADHRVNPAHRGCDHLIRPRCFCIPRQSSRT